MAQTFAAETALIQDGVAPDTGSDIEVIEEPAAISTTDLEKFIPVTRFALLDRLTRPENWGRVEWEAACRTFSYMGAWRHQDYCHRLLKLKEAYFPFSPDRDTVRILEYNAEEKKALQERLVNEMTNLLVQANYRKISEEDLDRYFTATSPYGLNLQVDLDEFEEVMVYCRGSEVTRNEYRSWRTLFLKKEVHEVPIFQRLFLMLKLKADEVRIAEIMEEREVDEKRARKLLKKERANLPPDANSDYIYLKLFKEINQSDLEMLFPNTKVAFKLWDKIRLGVTAGGGTIAGVVGTGTKLLAAIIAANVFAVVGGMIALVALIWRQISKFFNQRNQYMMVLAQNLYFHNLANNRGVLTLLCDRAEEEDVKEEMLLYAYLTQYKVRKVSLVQAKRAIETYLKAEFGVEVDYDIEDALGRLVRDGLVKENEDDTVQSLPPASACAHLEGMWHGALSKVTTQAEGQA